MIIGCPRNLDTLQLRYLYDSSDRPFAGVYMSNTCSATAFAIETSDRGDVRELMDASGASFALYSYDAYGNPTGTLAAGTGSAAEIAGRQTLRYAAYAWDSVSSLYYCSARYYDPAVAQFVSKDPRRADGEESAYQYCGGDPAGAVDPSGCRWIGKRVANEKQKESMWCTEACTVATVKLALGKRYKKRSISQEWCARWFYRRYPGHYPKILNPQHPLVNAEPRFMAALMRKRGLKKAKSCAPLKLRDLKRRLRRKKPVIACMEGSPAGHVVVLDRISDGRKPKVDFMDPIDGRHNDRCTFAGFPHPRHKTGKWFRSVVSG
jgi:RHS repeat-associated protein